MWNKLEQAIRHVISDLTASSKDMKVTVDFNYRPDSDPDSDRILTGSFTVSSLRDR